jgi:GrpB-like predicted nucleotidyltransferase (UPF0157 family)
MSKPATLATVQVVDYDPDWHLAFSWLKDQIWPSVRDAAIEHVGSTAVPGMAGKPVIDVDIVIASQTDLQLLRLRLRTLGYVGHFQGTALNMCTE